MRWRPSRTPSDCREIKGQDTVNRFVIHIYGNAKQLFLIVENSCFSYDILNPNECTQKNEEPSGDAQLGPGWEPRFGGTGHQRCPPDRRRITLRLMSMTSVSEPENQSGKLQTLTQHLGF